jgi:hypothetical protein
MHPSIRVVTGIHKSWLLGLNIGAPLFGRDHFYYYSNKGTMSLISIHYLTGTRWEICELDKEHDVLEDGNIQQFNTKEDAEKRIEELLKVETE